jgi:hypothetical protein
MNISAKPKAFIALALLLAACSSANSLAKSPLGAIEQIRTLAGFPKSTVSFVETTTMINSPNGDLQVDLYQDEEGRKFFVDPSTNTVVEIDARDLMPNTHSGIVPVGVAISQAELEKRAEVFVRLAVPNFPSLENSLSYEAGEKGDLSFFTWRVSTTQTYFMPPFVQVGLTSNGDIFAFYNTLAVH